VIPVAIEDTYYLWRPQCSYTKIAEFLGTSQHSTDDYKRRVYPTMQHRYWRQ